MSDFNGSAGPASARCPRAFPGRFGPSAIQTEPTNKAPAGGRAGGGRAGRPRRGAPTPRGPPPGLLRGCLRGRCPRPSPPASRCAFDSCLFRFAFGDQGPSRPHAGVRSAAPGAPRSVGAARWPRAPAGLSARCQRKGTGPLSLARPRGLRGARTGRPQGCRALFRVGLAVCDPGEKFGRAPKRLSFYPKAGSGQQRAPF